MKRAIILVATCLGLLFSHSAWADDWEKIMASGKLRVATDLAIPPSGMLDSELKPTGSDVETAQLLADSWGVELEFIATTGATRIPNLQTDKADIIISTLSVTPQRGEVIDFSRPYAGLRSVIGAPRSENIQSWDDLKGKTIAVTRGTTQDSTLTATAAQRGISIQRFDDDATLVTAAVSGQAYAVATSETLIKQIALRNKNLAFEPKLTIEIFNLAIGLRKNEPKLMEELNKFVSENLKNGKLGAIYEKYHGAPVPDEIINQ